MDYDAGGGNGQPSSAEPVAEIASTEPGHLHLPFRTRTKAMDKGSRVGGRGIERVGEIIR